jgi:pyruvyltransferase
VTTEDVHGVDVEHWNPFVPRLPGRLGARLPLGGRRNNFGDLLGPVIVRALVERSAGADGRSARQAGPRPRLVAVGSILHFAEAGDTVWGSGVNGKVAADRHVVDGLDVRAVRGPKTADFLEARGLRPPAVFGDPGLLAPMVFPQLDTLRQEPRHALTIVPNLHDHPTWASHPDAVDPTGDLIGLLERIAQSERVVGSSLHGLVIAESLGIPATLIAPETETLFKYEDYYAGTGRASFPIASDLASALAQPADALDWNPAPLLDAFPIDLWTTGASQTSTSTDRP